MLDYVRKSLGAKISLAVILLLVGFFSVLYLVNMYNERKSTIETYRRNTRLLASTIEKSLITSMKEGRNEDVQKVLEDLATQDEITSIQIFDEKGNILRSTNRGELGGMVDGETMEEFKQSDQGGVVSEDSPGILSFIKPIYNGPQCFGCHPPGRKINGVLHVRVSMDRAYQDIRKNMLFSLKWGLLTILCVALSEALLLRRMVGEPVRKIATAMRRAEEGGHDFDLKIGGRDELAELSRVFQGMLDRISEMGRKAMEKEKELVRGHEALKSQALLASVIDGIPDGVAIMDREMRLVLMNPRYGEMFPDARVGEHCYMGIHKRSQPCQHCGMMKVFEDGKIHDHQSSVALPDGTVRVVHSISAPIRGEGGEIVRAVEVVRDMTERVVIPPADQIEVVERRWTAKKPGEYRPYETNGDMIPDMVKAGDGYRIHITGLTHDERGYPSMTPETQDKLVRRLLNKIRLNADKLVDVREEHTEDADVTVVSFGITSRVAAAAVEEARARGLKVGHARLVITWPFPAARMAALAERTKVFLVPELNMGQMVQEVERAVAGRAKVVSIPHAGGTVHEPETILAKIMEAAR